MKAKLKEGVFGFTWNFESGEIEEIFTEELTSREIELMGRVAGDDISMILDNSDIELIFGEDLEEEGAIEDLGLEEVLELVA